MHWTLPPWTEALVAFAVLVWRLPLCAAHDLCGLLRAGLGEPPQGRLPPATAEEREAGGARRRGDRIVGLRAFKGGR